MGGHTFGFPHERGLPISSIATNGTGAAAGRPSRARTGWQQKRDAGTFGRHGMKWKLAVGAMTIIFLHVFGVHILFPLITHHTIGSTQDADKKSLGTPPQVTSEAHGDGGFMRILSETATAWTLGEQLSRDQAILMDRYGDKAFRGHDVWMQQDAMSNPLILPPRDLEAAQDAENIQTFVPRKLTTLYREKCGNSTLLPYNGGTGREWVTSSRTWTRAYGQSVSKYRWCRGGSNIEVPELKRVLMLRSPKPRPERAVTVVTQLSLERASMLEQQCSLWPHPIAAVVYIPLLKGRIFSSEEGPWNLSPLEEGIAEMKAMHERLSALPDGCVLDLEVVAEECCNKDIGSMYPTNAVRNRALHLASTEVVLLLDADFIVDLSLARTLEDPQKYEELVKLLSEKNAMLLPAFEAWDQGEWGKKVALEAVHNGKPYISSKFMYNVVLGFHMSHYPQGHEKTNFWRWLNSTEPYEVEYQIGFEPYIMLLKKFAPYYDERFRGYYWNKVQQLMHVSLQNSFKFIVHPQAFVVHAPHKKPSTKIRTRRSGQKERNHVMFLEALEDMKHDRFVPVTGFPHLCLPPDMQRAIAELVPTQQQQDALKKMAHEVKKVPHEELKGGGAEALARARAERTYELSEAGKTSLMVREVIDKEAKEGEQVEVEEIEGDENAAAGAMNIGGRGRAAAQKYRDEMLQRGEAEGDGSEVDNSMGLIGGASADDFGAMNQVKRRKAREGADVDMVVQSAEGKTTQEQIGDSTSGEMVDDLGVLMPQDLPAVEDDGANPFAGFSDDSTIAGGFEDLQKSDGTVGSASSTTTGGSRGKVPLKNINGSSGSGAKTEKSRGGTHHAAVVVKEDQQHAVALYVQ